MERKEWKSKMELGGMLALEERAEEEEFQRQRR